jgi:hypothetical protein
LPVINPGALLPLEYGIGVSFLIHHTPARRIDINFGWIPVSAAAVVSVLSPEHPAAFH